MKKILSALLIALLMLSLCACASSGGEQEPSGAQEQPASSPDADWNLPETIGMTEEVTAMFENAVPGIPDVRYEPQGFLGEKDGVYCVLCRATAVSPDAAPYYALVYVTAEGVANIWDIWMGAHAGK